MDNAILSGVCMALAKGKVYFNAELPGLLTGFY